MTTTLLIITGIIAGTVFGYFLHNLIKIIRNGAYDGLVYVDEENGMAMAKIVSDRWADKKVKELNFYVVRDVDLTNLSEMD